jgi:hypothetical protein
MVVEDGKKDAFILDELANLAAPQIELMRQSELEIREIAGTNADVMGYETSSSKSGVAKQLDIQRSQVTTASLFDNFRRSLKILGDQTVSNIQQFWKYEKILRVTDRLTGAERFITVNQQTGEGVKHDITKAKFDVVISEVQASDTVREKNMDILYAAIEKSPPEAVPTLLLAAFEMSDLPNKELLIEKLKPVLNIDLEDETEDPEEAKQRVLMELKAQKEQAAIMAQIEQEAIEIELNKKKLENAELKAKIRKLHAEAEQTEVETEIAEESHELDQERAQVEGFEKGMDIGERLMGKDESQGERINGSVI